MSRETRNPAMRTLRDLILTGNMMAMKIGQDPNNLANTWDEMVERVRASGLLEKLAFAELGESPAANLPGWIATREAEAVKRNDMPCWRAFAERLALECLTYENDGLAVPLALRLKADDAWQQYQNLHPVAEPE